MAGIDSDTFIRSRIPVLIRNKLPKAVFNYTGVGDLYYDVTLYDGIVFSFSRLDYRSTGYGSTYSYVFSFTKDGVCFKESYNNETLAEEALDEFLTKKPTLPTWVIAKLAPLMEADGYKISLNWRKLETFSFLVWNIDRILQRTLKVGYDRGKWNLEISRRDYMNTATPYAEISDKFTVAAGALDASKIEHKLRSTASNLAARVSWDIDVCRVLNRLTALLVLE
jgi:lipopolysaccharide assembly outer membrane protein LptD (OstA)